MGERLASEYGDQVCIKKDGVILVSIGTAQCLPNPSGPGDIAIAAGSTSRADASLGYGNIAIGVDSGDAAATGSDNK